MENKKNISKSKVYMGKFTDQLLRQYKAGLLTPAQYLEAIDAYELGKGNTKRNKKVKAKTTKIVENKKLSNEMAAFVEAAKNAHAKIVKQQHKNNEKFLQIVQKQKTEGTVIEVPPGRLDTHYKGVNVLLERYENAFKNYPREKSNIWISAGFLIETDGAKIVKNQEFSVLFDTHLEVLDMSDKERRDYLRYVMKVTKSYGDEYAMGDALPVTIEGNIMFHKQIDRKEIKM